MRNTGTSKESLLHNLGGLFILAAVATLLPLGNANQECMLGYHAICSFAPFSTLLCLIAGAMAYGVKDKSVSPN
jgi:hypothetical protein